ncbi:MAG: ATP-grasp domain-containing protein [Mesorhizobium sp.]|uniref:ATP-grasp domain-containing protein n=1 Tax=Mesorhizobium sp. TaxID=1871066 RepID=UPI00122A34A4|nr:acetyl-CoA carboxylase biotin carboxylase subunit family protein [Mesorhizobium sp.]TIO11922.1 MAG: ATP-grasp domain-containing protein [Mesorhizobium sp.]
MARRALILVEGESNMLRYVQAAQRLGLHLITLSSDPARYDYLAAEAIETIRVDTDNVDALIHECSRLRRIHNIAGITSATELTYATVGKLCRYFNLPGPNPVSIERCCDKFTQRQLLAKAGVPIPAYRLATNAAEVNSSAVDIGLPVVLKPSVGIGSSGVRLCRTVDEVAAHANYLLDGRYIWRSSPSILVEEFVQGPLYVAHTMGNEVIGIGAVEFQPPPYFVCLETIFPAPLSDDEHKSIADVSITSLRGLGLGWGPTNIELRWTKRGPVVIEVNPRLAGAPDAQLVQLACGVDLIAEHIKLVIGEQWDLRKRRSHTAGVRSLLPTRDGILDWIDGSRAAAVSGVAEVKFFIEPKTSIVRKGESGDKMAYVVAASPSRGRTEGILQRAVELIDWSITPSPAPGGEVNLVATPRLEGDQRR